jgi:hypothetical protein
MRGRKTCCSAVLSRERFQLPCLYYIQSPTTRRARVPYCISTTTTLCIRNRHSSTVECTGLPKPSYDYHDTEGGTKEHDEKQDVISYKRDNGAESDALQVVRTAERKQANHFRRETGSIFGASWMTMWLGVIGQL